MDIKKIDDVTAEVTSQPNTPAPIVSKVTILQLKIQRQNRVVTVNKMIAQIQDLDAQIQALKDAGVVEELPTPDPIP